MVLKPGHWKVDKKYLEDSQIWCWNRKEMRWNDRMKNEEYYIQREQDYPTYNRKKAN
jgi:hypothetical protein